MRTINEILHIALLLLCIGYFFSFAEPTHGQAVAGINEVSSTQVQSIAGQWKFKAGDEPIWASATFDDSQWPQITVPRRWSDQGFPQTNQFAWYRLKIQLAPATEGDWGQLGVEIGKVLSAYEFYAGGKLLGGIGALPPNSDINYDQTRVYSIPYAAVSQSGELVLALRVWGGSDFSVGRWGGGTHDGKFRLGRHVDLLEAAFLDLLPGFVLCILFFGFGLYHLYLYMRNTQLHGYLWYGLTALNISLYGLMSNQLRYHLDWDFISLEKVELSAIYVFPAILIQMIWTLFSLPIGRLLRAYQLSFIVWSLSLIVIPGVNIIIATLHIFEAWALLAIAPMLYSMIKETIKGNPEARIVLIGVLVFLVTCTNDIMIDLARWDTIRLIPAGFAAIMLAMAISLANKFTTAFNNLECEVEARTEELKSANDQLAEAASRDMLTGLLNRRGFSTTANAEVKRSLRSNRPFSLILSDIDKFKIFNDTHGHACGDYVLQKIASLLSGNIREVDSAARWGGEEFILMLPEVDHVNSMAVAEKIRKVIEQHKFVFEGKQLEVTMTFGIAVFNAVDSLEQCIQRADEALYRGKDEGRNRVVI